MTPRDFAKEMMKRLEEHETEQRPLKFQNRTLADLWDELNTQWGNRIHDSRIQIKNGDIDIAIKNIEHIGNYLFFVWDALHRTNISEQERSDVQQVNVVQPSD